MKKIFCWAHGSKHKGVYYTEAQRGLAPCWDNTARVTRCETGMGSLDSAQGFQLPTLCPLGPAYTLLLIYISHSQKNPWGKDWTRNFHYGVVVIADEEFLQEPSLRSLGLSWETAGLTSCPSYMIWRALWKGPRISVLRTPPPSHTQNPRSLPISFLLLSCLPTP